MGDLGLVEHIMYFFVIPFIAVPVFVYAVTFVHIKAKIDALVHGDYGTNTDTNEDEKE